MCWNCYCLVIRIKSFTIKYCQHILAISNTFQNGSENTANDLMPDMNTLLPIHNARSTKITPILTDLWANEFLGLRGNLGYSLDSKTGKFCQ